MDFRLSSSWGPDWDRRFGSAIPISNAQRLRDRRRLRSVTSERDRLEFVTNELQSQVRFLASQLEDVGKRLEEIRSENRELASQLTRAQSDAVRYLRDAQMLREDSQEQQARVAQKTRLEAAQPVMKVADSFSRSLTEAKSNGMDEAWLSGFKAMSQIVTGALESQGFVRFESLGDEPDPGRHEVVTTVPSQAELSGKIVGVIEDGYEDADSADVVRVAKVVIGVADGD